MRGRARHLVVMASVAALVVAGCATGERGTGERGSMAKPRSATGSNEHCDWEFDYGIGKKIEKESLKAKEKPGTWCKVVHFGPPHGPPLYIGEKGKEWEIRFFKGPAEFGTKGSCRYCYINTSGGMSCIEYPGPPC